MKITELDWRAPVDVFAAIAGEADAHLLHAGERARARRWSFIVRRPATRFALRSGRAFVDGAARAGNPFEVLAGLVDQRAAQREDRRFGPPFLTGAVGFVGYEAGAVLEPAAAGPVSAFAFPDAAFGFYDAALAFDRDERRAYLVERDAGAGEGLVAVMAGGAGAPDPAGDAARVAARGLASNFSRAGYEGAVAAIVEKIRDGDVFQVNIAQHLCAEMIEADAYGLFRRLAADSAAPFGALLQFDEGAILSNSPERFFQITPQRERLHIRAEPIKGTRARGSTPREDAARAADLLSDAKERAENIMIADLLRNDLSRICVDDSIEEPQICALVSDARVHHLVSTVTGELRAEQGAVDALRALFPCGSITGAPKIAAMKAIGELERTGRGPYCGAIGYIDDGGAADFAVAIRVLMVLHPRGAPTARPAPLVFPVGGGVTLRSDPALEYEETLHKARAFLDVLGLEGGRLA